MVNDWKELTALTRGARVEVERVRLVDTGIAIEGSFELPALAQLPMDDQVFIGAFVRSHGSIKEMERLFGVSYPTVKGRLNRLSETLGLGLAVEMSEPADASSSAILGRLERGEITAKDAAEALKR